MSASWVTEVDPASGSTYFFNLATSESTWDKPDGFEGELPVPKYTPERAKIVEGRLYEKAKRAKTREEWQVVVDLYSEIFNVNAYTVPQLSHVEYFYERAYAYLRLEKYDRAMDDAKDGLGLCRETIQRNRDNDSFCKNFRTYIGLLEQLLTEARLVKPKWSWRGVSPELDPLFARLEQCRLSEKAKAALERENWDEAVEYYDRCFEASAFVKAYKTPLSLFTNRGNARYQLGAYVLALSDAEAGLKIYNDAVKLDGPEECKHLESEIEKLRKLLSMAKEKVDEMESTSTSRASSHDYASSRVRQCSVYGCTKKGVRECGQCGREFYCSKKCQTQHWKSGHRKICNAKVSTATKEESVAAEHKAAAVMRRVAELQKQRSKKQQPLVVDSAVAPGVPGAGEDAGVSNNASASPEAGKDAKVSSLLSGSATGSEREVELSKIGLSEKVAEFLRQRPKKQQPLFVDSGAVPGAVSAERYAELLKIASASAEAEKNAKVSSLASGSATGSEREVEPSTVGRFADVAELLKQRSLFADRGVVPSTAGAGKDASVCVSNTASTEAEKDPRVSSLASGSATGSEREVEPSTVGRFGTVAELQKQRSLFVDSGAVPGAGGAGKDAGVSNTASAEAEKDTKVSSLASGSATGSEREVEFSNVGRSGKVAELQEQCSKKQQPLLANSGAVPSVVDSGMGAGVSHTALASAEHEKDAKVSSLPSGSATGSEREAELSKVGRSGKLAEPQKQRSKKQRSLFADSGAIPGAVGTERYAELLKIGRAEKDTVLPPKIVPAEKDAVLPSKAKLTEKDIALLSKVVNAVKDVVISSKVIPAGKKAVLPSKVAPFGKDAALLSKAMSAMQDAVLSSKVVPAGNDDVLVSKLVSAMRDVLPSTILHARLSSKAVSAGKDATLLSRVVSAVKDAVLSSKAVPIEEDAGLSNVSPAKKDAGVLPRDSKTHVVPGAAGAERHAELSKTGRAEKDAVPPAKVVPAEKDAGLSSKAVPTEEDVPKDAGVPSRVLDSSSVREAVSSPNVESTENNAAVSSRVPETCSASDAATSRMIVQVEVDNDDEAASAYTAERSFADAPAAVPAETHAAVANNAAGVLPKPTERSRDDIASNELGAQGTLTTLGCNSDKLKHVAHRSTTRSEGCVASPGGKSAQLMKMKVDIAKLKVDIAASNKACARALCDGGGSPAASERKSSQQSGGGGSGEVKGLSSIFPALTPERKQKPSKPNDETPRPCVEIIGKDTMAKGSTRSSRKSSGKKRIALHVFASPECDLSERRPSRSGPSPPERKPEPSTLRDESPAVGKGTMDKASKRSSRKSSAQKKKRIVLHVFASPECDRSERRPSMPEKRVALHVSASPECDRSERRHSTPEPSAPEPPTPEPSTPEPSTPERKPEPSQLNDESPPVGKDTMDKASKRSSRKSSTQKQKRVALNACASPECDHSERRRREFLMCGGCSARYCSEECTRSHWKVHRKTHNKAKSERTKSKSEKTKSDAHAASKQRKTKSDTRSAPKSKANSRE